MKVRLVQETPTSLCLRARPANWVIGVTMIGTSVIGWFVTGALAAAGDIPDWTRWPLFVGVCCLAAVGQLAARAWCTIDRDEREIAIGRGLFSRTKARFGFDQVKQIAIRQRVIEENPNYLDGDSFGACPDGIPEELKPLPTILELLLVLNCGQEITVVRSMPGGTEGMAIVRKLERFRKGV